MHTANEQALPTHGKLYWFIRKSAAGIGSFCWRHKAFSAITSVLVFSLLFWQRPLFHPLILGVRKFSFLAVIIVPASIVLMRLLKHRTWHMKSTVWALVILAAALGWRWEAEAYHYVKLYFRYQTLPIQSITKLPLTDHERIQPLNSIYSLALEKMIETEAPTPPDFVRIGDDYRFVMGIEPAYPVPRIFGGVNEVLSVPGTTPSTSFDRKYRIPVHFNEGENLRLARNSATAVIRAFGPFRFWSYEPADVIYITDDSGEWVQIVTLVRWRGIFFPRPEFGGVQVVRQSPNTIANSIKRSIIGNGTWVPPDEISRHQYLVGQNVVSYAVSRFVAESFRFQSGFMAPFPGYHRGDIRIPDLPEDVNDQPYTCYFRLASAGGGDKLYHYFALEPFDPDKQGLNTSVFVPADGIGPIFAYRHHETSGTLTGVSAIATKVMESKKMYDWTRHRPVENVPFIREIGGATRFFWRTTIITFKDDPDGARFIAGTIPEVVLTDAAYNAPVWVDVTRPDEWTKELEEELSPLWAKQ